MAHLSCRTCWQDAVHRKKSLSGEKGYQNAHEVRQARLLTCPDSLPPLRRESTSSSVDLPAQQKILSHETSAALLFKEQGTPITMPGILASLAGARHLMQGLLFHIERHWTRERTLPAPDGPTSAINSPGTTTPEVGCNICLLCMVCLSSTCSDEPAIISCLSCQTVTCFQAGIKLAQESSTQVTQMLVSAEGSRCHSCLPCRPGHSMRGLQGIRLAGHRLTWPQDRRCVASICGGACMRPAFQGCVEGLKGMSWMKTLCNINIFHMAKHDFPLP